MKKRRMTQVFKCYEGLQKREKDGRSRWVLIGEFSSLEQAKEAGATKFRPRFRRS